MRKPKKTTKKESIFKGLIYAINSALWPAGVGCSVSCLLVLAILGKNIEAFQQGLVLYLLLISWPRYQNNEMTDKF